MEPYNTSPEQSHAAAIALLNRGLELQQADEVTDAIWNNIGFHAATVMLEQTGVRIPLGPHAQVYISLVLAASEHVKAQDMLEDAAGALLDEELT